MGTDIHGAIERRNLETGSWEPFEFTFPDNRDYDVFSILADVRNGHGFAGVPTSQGFNPIAEQRGYPEDMHPDTSEKMSHEHSASWLLLSEVINYDYSQETIKCGVISWDQYVKFRQESKRYSPAWKRWGQYHPRPDEYSGSIMGKGIYTIEQAQADKYGDITDQPKIADGNGGIAERVHVRVYWPVHYFEEMKDFLIALLPLVKYGMDDIRLVFDFDS